MPFNTRHVARDRAIIARIANSSVERRSIERKRERGNLFVIETPSWKFPARRFSSLKRRDNNYSTGPTPVITRTGGRREREREIICSPSFFPFLPSPKTTSSTLLFFFLMIFDKSLDQTTEITIEPPLFPPPPFEIHSPPPPGTMVFRGVRSNRPRDIDGINYEFPKEASGWNRLRNAAVGKGRLIITVRSAVFESPSFPPLPIEAR